MHMYFFSGKKKKTETKLKLTVSELRELFECKLFFIIIINMKKKKELLNLRIG